MTNKFAEALFSLNQFCRKSNVIQYPTVKLSFKTSRERAYFEAQFKREWQIEWGMPPQYLDKFKMIGFDVEFILEE